MKLTESMRGQYRDSKLMPYFKVIIGIILSILGFKIIFTYLPPLITGAPFKIHNPLILVGAFFCAGLVNMIDFLEMPLVQSKKNVKSTIISMVINFVVVLALLLYFIVLE